MKSTPSNSTVQPGLYDDIVAHASELYQSLQQLGEKKRTPKDREEERKPGRD